MNYPAKTAFAAILLASAMILASVGNAATGDFDSFYPAVSGSPYATAVLPEVKVLLGGYTYVGFLPNIRTNLARFLSDGTLETNFNAGFASITEYANCVAVQPDGKILIGGAFHSLAGISQQYLARVYSDGSLDTNFAPVLNNGVLCIAMQPDGRILIGGYFFMVNGASHSYIARLNTNGTVDATFAPSAGSSVNCLALQDDGKILVGGNFITLNATARNYIGRLNADGTLDTGFTPSADNSVQCITVQPDGKLLVAGPLGTNNCWRLNSTGTMDTNFTPNVNSQVTTMALQADGKIVIAGNFTSVGGISRMRFARLDAAGTLDATLNPFTISDVISTMALQADGRIILANAGRFVNASLQRNAVVRLVNDAATQSLLATATNRMQWLRGGTSPEAQFVSFELSTDGGSSYSMLGNGTRISGGWEITGLSLPASGQMRARAREISGQYNGSSGLIERVSFFGPLTATNLSAPETYVEDTPTNLTPILVRAPDTTNVTATLTLSIPAAGSLSVATSGVVVATFTSSNGVWTASGPTPDVNVLLANVTFRPATNYNANFTIATSVSDGVTTLTGTKSITGIAVNDPPTASNLSAPQFYTEDTPLTLTAIVINDVDSPNVTATLTLSTANAGSLSTATSGSVTSTYNPATGVWTASGPIANVNTLLAGVVFHPATNYNSNFTIATSVSDGVAPAITGTKNMTGIPVNDPPTATNLSAPETYTEDTPLNLTDIVISDVDSPNVTATLALSTTNAGSLTTGTSGAVTSTYNSSTGLWTASGAIADVNTLLAGVIFVPATNYNSNFTIATSVSDGVAPAITGTKNMTGIPVNDPPTATNLSAPETYTEDTPLNLIDIVISDVDSPNVTATLTLSTANAGSLSTGTSGPVTSTFSPATGVWTASGPIANVNTLLAGVVFHPATNYNANFTIATSASDGVAPAITGTKMMTGIPVNDMPVFTKGPDQSVPFGTTNAQTVVNWATGIDDGDPEIIQSLTFNLTNSNPALFSVAPSLAPNGTLTYTPTGLSGTATIGVSLTDDATAGGPALTTPVQTFTITVTAPVTPPPPVISSAAMLSNGAFQLTFTNTNNIAFSVLASTDISLPVTNWTLLGASTNLGGGLHGFTDAQATNHASRFYFLRFP